MSTTARCPKCGTTLGKNARFCSICGEDVTGAAAAAAAAAAAPPTTGPASAHPLSQPAPRPEMDAAGKRKILLAAVLGVLLVGIAGFLLARAAGVLSADKTTLPSGSVLSAPPTEPAGAPVLTAPTVQAPQAPVLQPPQTHDIRNPMPADVIDYLRWLKKFEAARRQLKSQSEAQLAIITGEMIKAPLQELMKEPDDAPTRDLYGPTRARINSLVQEWNRAAGLFQQRTPPNPCANLAGSYNQMLTGTVAESTKILSGLQQALASASQSGGNMTPDIQQMLNNLYGEANSKSASQSIDQMFAQSDSALDAVRAPYTDIPDDINKANFQISDESRVKVPAPPGMPGLGL